MKKSMISEKTSSYENFLSVYQPKAKLKKEYTFQSMIEKRIRALIESLGYLWSRPYSWTTIFKENKAFK